MVIVGSVVVVDEFVEFVQRCDLGYGHEVVAPEPSDIAFHTAFFVSPGDSGLAIERVEVKVRPERHPAVRFDALAGEPDHLGHSGFEVVVANLAGGHAAEHLEGVHVALEEGFLPSGCRCSVNSLG